MVRNGQSYCSTVICVLSSVILAENMIVLVIPLRVLVGMSNGNNSLVAEVSHDEAKMSVDFWFLRGMIRSASTLNSGAQLFRILGSQKLACFFNFPVPQACPKKIVWFLLAATSNHVQVRLDCTSRIKKLLSKEGKSELTGFLIYSEKARMSRIYYLRSRSSLGCFVAL